MDTPSIALVVVVKHLNSQNAAYGAVQNFIDVCDSNVESIHIIGPETFEINRGKIEEVSIKHQNSTGFFSRIFDYIAYQFKVARQLYERRHQCDIAFFHIGGSMLLIPILLCHLVQLRSVIFITGSIEKSYYSQHGRNVTSRLIVQIIKCIEILTWNIADEIILLSEGMNLPHIYTLSTTTITTSNFNYIDCTDYKKKTAISNRKDDLIFLGRLESVKGIQKIVHALPDIVEEYPTINLKIVGDGTLRDELEDFVQQKQLTEHVTFTGWINHDEIPDHLDNSRILLLPSESEGVPKTLLEAMACGTIPIATSVGGIPDIINDSENGFLLSNAESEKIAEQVSQVLKRNDLDSISNNARRYIEKKYSYEIAKEQYRRILADELSER